MAVELVNFANGENFALNFLTSDYHRETKYWVDIDYSVENPLLVYDVNLYSEEANKLIDEVTYYTPLKHDIKFLQIERIQNPYLMTAYLLNKRNMREEHGSRVKSRKLLHGTPSCNIAGIMEHNFDLNFTKRSRYGKGIYFTSDLAFASKFSQHGSIKHVIVANVLQTASCPGYADMSLPYDGCDTSENLTSNYQDVIVKYDENMFCPSYVLTIQIKNKRFKRRY